MLLRLADRMIKALADATVGTAIVLFHVALADRDRDRARGAVVRSPAEQMPDWLTEGERSARHGSTRAGDGRAWL